MSDQKEKLSAFFDDNLDRDERLDADHASERAMRHYSLIGDAMRGEVSEASMVDISQQVREALADEPALSPTATAEPAPEKAKRGGWFDFSSWMQPVGGLAIAASVAMIAVVSLDQSGESSLSGQQNIAESAPVEGAIESAPVRAVASTRETPDISPASGEYNLEHYLDEHSEFAASDTLQGRLPYVRAVGYKTRER